jgi:hypothetical protein
LSATGQSQIAPVDTTINKNDKPKIHGKMNHIGKPCTIYKTKKNYSYNVPVTLSADKTKIVSYPSPADVFYNGQLAYPTKLVKGYLLDNRGVSLNTAFTKYTYKEYSKLKEAPDLKTLYNSIIDKNPITEMYDCGNGYRFKNEVLELNEIIKKDSLSSFKKIK